MIVKALSVELRGIANKIAKKTGAVYYMVNVEDADGSAYSFYCDDRNALPDGLKKGDIVNVVFDYAVYGDNKVLFFKKLEKVAV